MQEHNPKRSASHSKGISSHNESKFCPACATSSLAAALSLCVAAMTLAFPAYCAPVSAGPAAPAVSAAATQPVVTPLAVSAEVKTRDEKVVVHLKPIPFQRVLRMSDQVPAGQMKVARPGAAGVLAKSYRVTYRDSAIVSSVFLSQQVVKSPVNEVTLAGVRLRAARTLPSRSGDYNRMRELSMVATGYSPREGSGSGRCATGMRAGYGVVAVDPRVIRLGSKLYISGYGYAVAGDTGGAIKRNRIDLGHNTYGEALGIGRRKVKVYVLDAPR